MPARSAGILMFRRVADGIEVLLVHPGGPFWAKKDEGAWSIPKGLIDEGEDVEPAARREFAEETGTVPGAELIPLGEFRQSGSKIVTAFAVEGDFNPATLVSNEIAIQWPPRSGRTMEIPEVDRAGWFAPDEAARKMLKGQVAILEALLERLIRK
jgi:predicted NUDIX family NTP pyrophosphohydrolase